MHFLKHPDADTFLWKIAQAIKLKTLFMNKQFVFLPQFCNHIEVWALTEPLRFYHFSVALVVTLRVIRVIKLHPVSDLLQTGKISSRTTLYLKIVKFFSTQTQPISKHPDKTMLPAPCFTYSQLLSIKKKFNTELKI